MSVAALDHCFSQSVPCVRYRHGQCQCAREERVLRHVAAGQPYPAFTAEECDWCKQQIVSVAGYREPDAEVPAMNVAILIVPGVLDAQHNQTFSHDARVRFAESASGCRDVQMTPIDLLLRRWLGR